MSQESTASSALAKYIPERDYLSSNYRALGRSDIDICVRCEDYYAKLFEKGLTKSLLPPRCTKHILSDIALISEEDFDDPEDYETFAIAADPVAWAYKYFSWQARWYQEEMMSCLRGDTLVYMGDGSLKKIEDIKQYEKVLTYDERGARTSAKTVVRQIDNGIKDIYKVTLENGDTLECTDDHQLFSWSRCGESHKRHKKQIYKNSYRSIKDGLEVGDSVFVINKFEQYGDILNKELGILLGYAFASMTFFEKELIFSKIERKHKEELKGLLAQLFPGSKVEEKEDAIKVDSEMLISFLEEIGIVNDENKQEKLLEYVTSLSEDPFLLFLNRAYSLLGKSSIQQSGFYKILLPLESKDVAKRFRLLIRKIGILSPKLHFNAHTEEESVLIEDPDDTLDLLEKIGHFFSREDESEMISTRNLERLKGVKRRLKLSSKQRILSIETIGQDRVYDIEVQTRHNFFAGGMVVHNCTSLMKVARCGRRTGKTICIVMLAMWMLATRDNFSILIVAPFESQVVKIFDEMEKFLNSSPELSNAVKRKTKSPCRLEFMNGSKALGFCSGSKSAVGSDKIRGQDANYIILDEADYLDDGDIDAILAILASHPDCGLWASSTPTGQHKKFYQFCVSKDLGFKEFWYISPEAPNWTDEVEQFFKTSVDSVTYDHEYNAEFGVQISGVFRNDLVDKSIRNYSLPKKQTAGSKTCIGVDWNGQAIGTHIIVTEAVLDQENNFKYVVLDKIVIRGGEFSQIAAVEKIIELDKTYNPEYIYVDAGFGQTQVEMLKKYGKRTQGSKLYKKVVPYAMGSNIEIRDPVTKRKIKKPAKPFMVNNSVLQIEQDRIILPVSEDTQILVDSSEEKESGTGQGLVQQMRNFSIERISSTGLPTYSQNEEHTLTAWMLSLAAFSLEMSDLRGKLPFSPPVMTQSLAMPTESHGKISKQGEVLANAARNIDLDNSSDKKGAGDEKRISIAKGDTSIVSSYYSKRRVDRTSGIEKRSFGSRRGRGF